MLNNMLPGDFCLWLKSLLDKRTGDALTAKETALIRESLSAVFRHEIDPQMGDDAHQAFLNKLHSQLMPSER
jgi:hypothetical protein